MAYQPGFSFATGLPDASADVVIAVQAMHWMEPVSTLAEVARILRPGGVFASFDADWPPVAGLAASRSSTRPKLAERTASSLCCTAKAATSHF